MRQRRWLLLLAALLVIGLLLCFPYGPLFPWSPWKPGYRQSASLRADVYYPRGTPLMDVYDNVDQLVFGAEKALDLMAPSRISVVLCRDWSDFERFMPHMRSRALGGVTLLNGKVIYITPKLDEKKFDHAEFLRHELLHAVMHQNQSILHGVRMRDVPWLTEGLAVSYGNQRAYFSRTEFLQQAKQEELLPILDPAQPAPANMRFAYPVWRYFTEFLRRQKGHGNFLDYTHAVMASPETWRMSFEQMRGQKFEQAVAEYQAAVRAATE